MDVERYEQRDDSPMREHRDDTMSDDFEENGSRRRSKDRKKSSRGEEKDSRSKDRDRSRRGGDDVAKEREKESKDVDKDRVSKDRRKEDRDERYKERGRDGKVRERDYDREKEHERGKDRKDREKDREVEKESDKGRDKERGGKEKNRDRDKEKDRAKEKEGEKEREKHKDREKGRQSVKDTDREKGKDKYREKERDADQDKEKSRDRLSRRSLEREDSAKMNDDDNNDKDTSKQSKISYDAYYEQNTEGLSSRTMPSTSELEERILKTKEERLKKKAEDIPEVLAWVNRSRKLEEKRHAEKEKALQLSRIFEEQDNVGEESEDEEAARDITYNLAGVKVLHGIDKVMEGGAVVLTLKDQNILADGDINEDVDMLENVELGEQKQRDDAYKAAKKKTGIYADKFNDDPSLEKKMLPQYDDPAADEGLTLDARGHFTGEAEKKLEELRKRLQGGSTKSRYEDLNMSGRITSDFYTNEEMLQMKKPKKKKTFRKKEKLDIDALEAEAVSAGLGAADLGSRNDAKRQAAKEELERLEVEKRNSAYQFAKAKADEASKALRQDTMSIKAEDDETPYFADDYDEIDKALERSRKIALKKKQEEIASGSKSIALVASAAASSTSADDQFSSTGHSQENKVVFTEMEEFVLGLQFEEETHKPESEDVFMQEDEEPKASPDVEMGEPSGWTEVKEVTEKEVQSATDSKDEVVPDETIHEVAVGKGLSGVLKLLKERGNLKEGIEWGGRNMDKKKSKLLGIVDDDDEPKDTHTLLRRKDEHRDTRSSGHQKEMRPPKVYQEKDIHIERTDEFGRTLTPKEAFRVLSHKFHGKGPGKMKQEKRQKQYQEELKLKQMKSSDTPSMSVERMRETQARTQSPYLVLSGHVKPGQTSDPRSGFATVEKDLPGGLTPMLGDRKVEHYLGIGKRKAEPESSGTPKKPKS